MRQVVLDTETTGLEVRDGHRIIEIGAFEIVGRRVTERRFHQYVNPQRDCDEGALAVHGINRQFLEGKPKFGEIVDDHPGMVILRSWIGGDRVVTMLAGEQLPRIC